MIWTRIQKVMLALLCGGMLLQSSGCVQAYVLPTAVNIIGAVVLAAALDALGLSGSTATTAG